MARPGVTQNQVDTVADALLRAGERPTIERVRAALGTGSPATLIRLLDHWWRDLGRRLAEVDARLALPTAPDEVTVAAQTFWTQALAAAEVLIRAKHAPIEAALQAERQQVQQELQDMASQSETWRTTEQALRHQLELAAARHTEAEQRIRTQDASVIDLQQQRDHLKTRLDQVSEALAAAEVHRLAQEAAHATERARTTDLLQSVENRANLEIDRAREESKKLSAQIQQVRRERDQVATQRTLALDELAIVRRQLAGIEARAETLKAELDRVHALTPSNKPLPRRPAPPKRGSVAKRTSRKT